MRQANLNSTVYGREKNLSGPADLQTEGNRDLNSAHSGSKNGRRKPG